MTDDDRKLLERAARAAGELTPSWYGNSAYFDGVLMRWNPLNDDGDALRLAVKLYIEVMPEVYGVLRCDTRNRRGEYFTEQATIGYSIEEATRRAIVRAAAATVEGGA